MPSAACRAGHRWTELLELCHILVADADSEAPEVLRDLLAARSVVDPGQLQGPAGQIACVWQTLLAVSATQIRHLLAENRSVRYLVPGCRTRLYPAVRTVLLLIEPR